MILELAGPRDGFDVYGRRWFKSDDGRWYPRDLSEADVRFLEQPALALALAPAPSPVLRLIDDAR